MKENECNGLEWRSNEVETAAKKMSEHCRRTYAWDGEEK